MIKLTLVLSALALFPFSTSADQAGVISDLRPYICFATQSKEIALVPSNVRPEINPLVMAPNAKAATALFVERIGYPVEHHGALTIFLKGTDNVELTNIHCQAL